MVKYVEAMIRLLCFRAKGMWELEDTRNIFCPTDCLLLKINTDFTIVFTTRQMSNVERIVCDNSLTVPNNKAISILILMNGLVHCPIRVISSQLENTFPAVWRVS
jgi:hypothetical protein